MGRGKSEVGVEDGMRGPRVLHRRTAVDTPRRDTALSGREVGQAIRNRQPTTFTAHSLPGFGPLAPVTARVMRNQNQNQNQNKRNEAVSCLGPCGHGSPSPQWTRALFRLLVSLLEDPPVCTCMLAH